MGQGRGWTAYPDFSPYPDLLPSLQSTTSQVEPPSAPYKVEHAPRTLSVLICPPPPGDTTPPHLVLRTLHIVCCRVSAGSLFAPRAALSLLGPALFEPSCAACLEATWINSLICTPRPSPCTLTTPANLMHLAASCKVLAILHIPSGPDRILTFRSSQITPILIRGCPYIK